jgi:hypothetical protein
MATIPFNMGIVSANGAGITSESLFSTSYAGNTALGDIAPSTAPLFPTNYVFSGNNITVQSFGTFIATANTQERLSTLTGSGGGGSSTPTQYWTM